MPMRSGRVLGCCLVVLILAIFSGPGHEAQAQGDADKGKKLFTHTCSACHGPQGLGVTGVAPRLNDPEKLSLNNDDFYRQTLRNGRPGTAMMSFKHLGDETIDDIVAFLRQWENPGEEPETTIQGNYLRGHELYDQHCLSCHGKPASEELPVHAGASVDLKRFLDQTDDADVMPVVDITHRGSEVRDFSGALQWAYMSDEDRRDIVVYLKAIHNVKGVSVEALEGLGGGSLIPTRPGDIAKGQLVFGQRCAACHQADGSGLIGLAPSLNNQDFLSIASDDFIRRTITEGRSDTSMTPWASLGADSIEDLVAYIRSWQHETTVTKDVDWTTRFKGDPADGRRIFNAFCAYCHGQKGEGYLSGGPGTGIGLPGFLNAASDGYIHETLKTGRVGTAMRSFRGSRDALANLSDDELRNVIVYLRALGKENFAFSASLGTTRKPDVMKGELTFVQRCAACHQASGTGRVGLAPSINNQDFLSLASDDFIRETIKYGRAGTTMTSWAALGDDTIEDLVAYIRSWQLERTPSRDVDWTQKLEGNVQNGQELFNQFCVYCHGDKGQGYLAGGPGTGIGLSSFLHAASDDYILQTLKIGRIGTAMKPFTGTRYSIANLSEQELRDIVAYLRSLEQ